MTEADVVSVLDGLDRAGVRWTIGGGWGVDALRGSQTRSHGDLDLLVDASDEAAALSALAALGFSVSADWRPVRVAVVDGAGREVDLHPVEFDDDGNGVQASLGDVPFRYPAEGFVNGRIGGRPVSCLSAAEQRRLHEGYPLRDVDRHDLAVLAELH